MKLVDRFLKYVSFDTQSDPSSETTPSSLKQLELGKYLAQELNDMGVEASLDEYGIVYASIPSNGGNQDTIGFIAHMDTSPDASGKDVKPQIIKNYDGKVITINKDLNMYLDPEEFNDLNKVVGHDLITTDGSTLLGADDKAGVAIIMTMVETIVNNKDIIHGDIKIAFTPDEEVGRGVDNFNVELFNADYAYTVDGGDVHEIGYENFNAYGVDVEVFGRSVHPGESKNRMINSILVAYEFEEMLPKFNKPQFTEGYEGFNHLCDISGRCDYTLMNYIIRNHDLNKAKAQINDFNKIKDYLNDKYGYEIIKIKTNESYLNMYEVLKNDMTCVNKLIDAMNVLELNPTPSPIRGGTDGSRLTYMGLPCPNIGTGGFNFHGRYEYASINMMKDSVNILLEIIK